MKVPANLSGERLIREYLSRVTDAATRYLPKGRRIAFVGRTRNLIERECGPGGLGDAARVRDVLTRLGDPVDLVKAERARLDTERAKRQSKGKEADDAGASEVTAPLQFRPLTSRWGPGTPGRGPRWRPPAGQGDARQDRPADGRGAAGGGKRKGRLGGLLVDWPPRKGTQPGAQASRQPPPGSPAGTAGQAQDGGAGQAQDGRAGQTAAGMAGRVPGGGTGHGQAPGGTAGQAPGGPASQAPGGTGGHQPGRAARRASDGAGAQAPGGAGARAPGGAGARAPGGAGPQAPGGAGGTILEGKVLGRRPGAGSDVPPAGRENPAAAGARQAASAVPSSGSPPARRTSALSHGTHKLQDVTAMAGHGVAQLAVSAAKMGRRYPLESVAVVLLGVGGLIFPFPFWLLGGLLAIWSRLWSAREKWIAIVGPPAFALVGTVITALVIGGRGNVFTEYPHAFHLDFGPLLRVGSVLCAGYLVLQLRRGPQRRLPPWQR